MIRALALLASILWAGSAYAQVCPAGSTCNPLEAYTYGSAAASAPYGAGVFLLAAPSASANSLVHIPANLLGTLTDTQTFTNKTLTSPTINAGALSGTFTGTPTFSGNVVFSAVPNFSGLLTGSIAPGKNLGLDVGGNLVVSTISGGGSPGGATNTVQYNAGGGNFGGAGPGSTTTVLHGNAAGAPSYSAVDLTADITGILAGANGGTGNGFFAVTGPASTLKTFTFPNASATVLTTNAVVTVPQGGTGIASGNSGGIPYFSGTTTIASSAALTANALVLGGGAGVAPSPLGSLGTTTTVLHGNASGAPSFGAVSLTADVSGILPVANGGTGTASPGLVAGTNVTITGSWPNQTINSSGGGGSSTGSGVDGGAGQVTVTASCTLGAAASFCGGSANNHAIRNLITGTLAGSITVTLDSIANVGVGQSPVCFDDSAVNGSGWTASHTVTITANASDAIGGGSAGGSVGPFTSAGSGICFRPTATHNWTVEASSTAAVGNCSANNFASGLTVNGLACTQPSISNLSGWGTNVLSAAGAALSSIGGLVTVVTPNGQQALGTSAISANTCATVITISASGVATTSIIDITPASDPTGVTGYGPSGGGLNIWAWPTTNTINVKVCNPTSGPITPGALTINYAVRK